MVFAQGKVAFKLSKRFQTNWNGLCSLSLHFIFLCFKVHWFWFFFYCSARTKPPCVFRTEVHLLHRACCLLATANSHWALNKGVATSIMVLSLIISETPGPFYKSSTTAGIECKREMKQLTSIFDNQRRGVDRRAGEKENMGRISCSSTERIRDLRRKQKRKKNNTVACFKPDSWGDTDVLLCLIGSYT